LQISNSILNSLEVNELGTFRAHLLTFSVDVSFAFIFGIVIAGTGIAFSFSPERYQPLIDSLQYPADFAICIRHKDDYSAVLGFPVFSQPEGEPYENMKPWNGA
jgi:hypothetical protein